MACGLALTDEGFDYSVLTYWRTRLRTSEHPERIFDAVRSVIDATGVLKGKTRRALDSTLLNDAVATQDTVTQLISAIRRVRRVVAGADEVPVSAHDYETSGKPLIAWDDPVAKAALVDGLVRDALALIEGYRRPRRSRLRPLGLLALVAGQAFPNKTSMAPGRSPSVWPRTGSSRPSIPRPATCASPALNTETATRPTSPSNPRPGW